MPRHTKALSPGGILIYKAGGGPQLDFGRQLSWRDRAGKLVKPVVSRGIIDFALSPDQKRLALERLSPQAAGSDLWVADLEHGTESRLTFDGTTRAYAPVWSQDGSRIAFIYGNRPTIFLRTSNGTGQEQVLFEPKEPRAPFDWSRDGRFLIIGSLKSLDALPLTGEGKPGDRKPIPLVRGEFSFWQGQLSPDGRWLAYVSNESGRVEVSVQPFALADQKAPQGKWQISTGGGNQPRWRGDGKELFYQALDNKIMASEVRSTGATFEHGTPNRREFWGCGIAFAKLNRLCVQMERRDCEEPVCTLRQNRSYRRESPTWG